MQSCFRRGKYTIDELIEGAKRGTKIIDMGQRCVGLALKALPHVTMRAVGPLLDYPGFLITSRVRGASATLGTDNKIPHTD